MHTTATPGGPGPARRHREGFRASLSLAVAVLLLAAGATQLAAPAGAQTGGGPLPAGRVVQTTDGDVAMPFSFAATGAVCFVNLEGDSYTGGDSVVLTLQGGCGGNSQAVDIRLADWGGHAAGTRLGPAQDSNKPMETLAPEPAFYYHDADGNGRVSPDDTVYLRMREADQARAMVLDVRITPFGDHRAGSRVESGDPDLNLGLGFLGTATDMVRQVDVHGSPGLTTVDFIFLTADPLRVVAGIGDVVLYSSSPALPFGTVLTWDHPIAKAPVTPVARHLCHLDSDGSASYTAGEPVFVPLSAGCGGIVSIGDARLSQGGPRPPGRVTSGDPELGAAYRGVDGARIGYLDEDGSGRLSPGDLVVVNIFSPAQNRVSAGDVLLTPTDRGAGAIIAAGDPLVGAALTNLGNIENLVAFPSFGGQTAPTRNDAIYLSPGAVAGLGLRPGDIRLVDVGSHPFGGPVDFSTGEVLPTLARNNARFCSADDLPGSEDQVYLSLDGGCPSTVQVGLVRMVPVGAQVPFSVVRAGDDDIGIGIGSVSGPQELRFRSVDGSGQWRTGDTLYLDIRNPGEDRVHVGDLRLTAAGDLPGGHFVVGGDEDLFHALVTLGSVQNLLGYVDVDRDGVFSPGDHAYATPSPFVQYVTARSARLTSSPAPFALPEPPPPPPPPEEPPVVPPPAEEPPVTPPPVEPPPPSAEEPPEEPPRTPGPALGVLLAAVAVLLWHRARRRAG